MGWKNVKEYYQIRHNVKMSEGNLCIGSSFISEIIVISPEGKFVKKYDRNSNDDLARYEKEIESDIELFKFLMSAPDTFEKSITVYTYDETGVIEKQCEAVGYPNTTHDGEMMYDNSFSTNREEVIAWGKRNTLLNVNFTQKEIKQLEEQLTKLKAEHEINTNRMRVWNEQYPD